MTHYLPSLTLLLALNTCSSLKTNGTAIERDSSAIYDTSEENIENVDISLDMTPDPYEGVRCSTDSTKIDCSEDFAKWFKTFGGEDRTEKLLTKYTLNTEMLFSSSFMYACKRCETEFYNGVFSNKYKRLQIHIDNEIEQIDKYTYKVHGTSRRNKVCRKFEGVIKIVAVIFYPKGEKIESCKKPQGAMLASYIFKEDSMANGSGIFTGKYISEINIGAHNCIDQKELDPKASKKNKDKIWLNSDMRVSDGYWNRGFTGQWESYDKKERQKANWGDFRIPYTFDFDIGAGEMSVNEKYEDDDWKEYNKEIFDQTHHIKKWW